ncbi:MAG: hypothetical protein ABIT06_13465, partial [Saprospiraceae bacterium]
MKKKFSIISMGFYLFISAIPQLLSTNSFAQDSYIVSVTDVKSRKVQIKARLFPNNDTILMSPFGANHLENGWANFVTDLVAKNKLNERINIQSIDGGAYVFSPYRKEEEINLEYTVNLTHEKEKWPFGYKEAAYVRESMIVFTGNALFISRLDMKNATVRFVLPKNFMITNAWERTGPNTYKVHNPTELVWTVMAIGQYNITNINTGKIKIKLVYNARLRGSKKMISSTITAAVKQYEKIYNGKPVNSSTQSDKFVYVINVDTGYVGGGAVFTNSISIMLHQSPSLAQKANTTSWHHILIHEIGHLWNGQSLKSEEQNEWFVEGLTDYLAYKVEYDLGLFNKTEWENMLKLKYKEYDQAYNERLSIKEAGNNKSENYDLIYSGGLLFA